VWVALCYLSIESDSNHVTPTRELLSKRTGIRRLATISTALAALKKAHWVRIQYVPIVENHKQVGTTLHITLLRRSNEIRIVGENLERQPQTPHRAHENRSLASARKSCAESSYEDRASYGPALSPVGGSERTPEPVLKTNNGDDGDPGLVDRPILEYLGPKETKI